MGYYKNKLIELDIEVGDRLPEPLSYTRHVALQDAHTDSAVSGWRLHVIMHKWRYYLHLSIAGVSGLVLGLIAGVLV